jgi:hypothetical protein
VTADRKDQYPIPGRLTNFLIGQTLEVFSHQQNQRTRRLNASTRPLRCGVHLRLLRIRGQHQPGPAMVAVRFEGDRQRVDLNDFLNAASE